MLFKPAVKVSPFPYLSVNERTYPSVIIYKDEVWLFYCLWGSNGIGITRFDGKTWSQPWDLRVALQKMKWSEVKLEVTSKLRL
ncbi:hypothetical protein CPB86DRAFT_339181 [Serendipita vermifera]|nr:hypothetical protein CPB86DRAFT_339181 [Serendipita vermifera]